MNDLQKALQIAGIKTPLIEDIKSDKTDMEWFVKNTPDFEDISDLPAEIRAKVIKARNSVGIKKAAEAIIKELRNGEKNSYENICKIMNQIVSQFGAKVKVFQSSEQNIYNTYSLSINGDLDIVYEIMMSLESAIRSQEHTFTFSNEKLNKHGALSYTVTFQVAF